LQATGRLRLGAFYGRRARRLLPAAVLVLVVTVAASWVWLSPLQARGAAWDAAAAALYVANYRFALQRTDYLADASPSPLQHYWSLGVEEQFYLLWPLLLLVVFVAGRRLRTRSSAGAVAGLALAGAGSLALSLRLTARSAPWAFLSLPTRAWELAAGGLIALSASTLRRLPGVAAATLGWLGLEAIAWSIARFSAATPFPGIAALLPVGGTAAVLAAGCAAPRLGPGRVLGWWPLQAGGKLSYSWYLWHWPLLVLAPAVAGHPLGLGQNLSLAAASGLLALATVKLVEDPVRFSSWLRARPGRSLALGAGLTVSAAAATMATAVLVPIPHGQGLAAPPAVIRITRPPPRARRPTTEDPAAARLASLSAPVVRAVAKAVTVGTVPANLEPSLESAHANQPRPVADGCLIRWLGVASGPCVYGSPASRRTVVLFGDSHALQWFPALDRAASAHRWRLVSLTKTTCPPVELSFWSPVLGRPYVECDRWRASMLQRIRAERPALVVLGAARHYGDVYHSRCTGRPGSPGWPRRSTRCGPPASRSSFSDRPRNQRWTCPTASRGTFTTPSPAPPPVGWPSIPAACGSNDRRFCALAAATWTSPAGCAPAPPAPWRSGTCSPTATTTTSPPPTRPGCHRCSAISSTRPSGPVGAAPAANQETPEGTRARCLGMLRVHNVLQVKAR
jgi:peptidoglycan/LPS O-acetylase OafA/YrhL